MSKNSMGDAAVGRLCTTTTMRIESVLYHSSKIIYSGVLSYSRSEKASRNACECVHTYKETSPPALPARSCRRSLYPGTYRWDTYLQQQFKLHFTKILILMQQF